MSPALINAIVSIIMSFFTVLGSFIGWVESRPDTTVIQGFEQKEEDELRVMSFNIRCLNVGTASWKDRIGLVSETMLNSDADSIGVQEATPEWMETLNDSVSDKYAWVGVGRDDGDNEGEYSAIFYRKDKYEVVDSGTFWLSETPDEPSRGWDAACNRICTWAHLRNVETNEEYVHMNSHFDHVGTKARANSVSLILEKAKGFGDVAVVFTADMNVKEGSENYLQFTESGFFYDTKHQAPDTMDYCTYHDTKPNLHQDSVIDYVMINDKFEATSYKVVTDGIDGKFVSDHYPVYADIILK